VAHPRAMDSAAIMGDVALSDVALVWTGMRMGSDLEKEKALENQGLFVSVAERGIFSFLSDALPCKAYSA